MPGRTKSKQKVSFDLQHLRSFRAVAVNRNFTRAAAELGYAQPTVTHHVQTLERQFGTPLLERERFSRHIVLTEAGKRVLESSESILTIVDQTSMAIADR